MEEERGAREEVYGEVLCHLVRTGTGVYGRGGEILVVLCMETGLDVKDKCI